MQICRTDHFTREVGYGHQQSHGHLRRVSPEKHRQHVWQLLPFLILLACPFMHLLMRGGHGGHDSHGQHNGESEQNA
jgi:hypothetical protein